MNNLDKDASVRCNDMNSPLKGCVSRRAILALSDTGNFFLHNVSLQVKFDDKWWLVYFFVEGSNPIVYSLEGHKKCLRRQINIQ